MRINADLPLQLYLRLKSKLALRGVTIKKWVTHQAEKEVEKK